MRDGDRTGSVLRRVVALVLLLACDPAVTPPGEIPIIALSVRELHLFSTAGNQTPDTATITISNNGAGSLDGLSIRDPAYAGGAADWLKAVLSDSTLRLSASAESLALGTYTASIDVELGAATNSPRTVTVSFDVGESQRIDVSNDRLVFRANAGGGLPPAQSLTVVNGGRGVLSELTDSVEYPAGGEQDWLTTSLVDSTAPTRVAARPTRVPPPGTHTATLLVSSRIASPGSTTVDVSFIVGEPPAIFVSADSVAFAAVERSTTPLSREITVTERNRQHVTGLALSLRPNAGWLTAALDSSVTPTGLTLTSDPTGLAPGVFLETVRLTSALGDTDSVAVALTVSQGPAIVASPDSVHFTAVRAGTAPVPQVVRIENDSTGTLSGLTATPTASWLSANLSSTTAPADLTLAVDTTGFTPGTQTASVVVSGSTPGQATVRVTFTMLTGPALALSADSVTFRTIEGGSIPVEQRLGIANGGQGTLTGLAVDPATIPSWLTATPADASAPTTLTLRPNTANLPPGRLVAAVPVNSPVAANTPASVTVVYEVASASAPRFALSPDSVHITLTQTEPIDSQFVTVANPGGGTLGGLGVDPATLPPWLSAAFDGPSAPARLALVANPTGVSPGDTVRADLVLTSSTANPTTLPVAFTLLPGPALALSSDTVRFRSSQGAAPPDNQTILAFNRAGGVLQGLSVGTTPNWLDAARSDTVAPMVLDLSVDPAALPGPGTFSQDVSVFSPWAANSPLGVTVVYELLPPPTPVITLAVDSVSFTHTLTEPAPQQIVDITNTGNAPLTVTGIAAPGSPSWLRVTLDSANNVPSALRLTVDTVGLSLGPHAAAVVITSNSPTNPDMLPVTLEVLPAPTIVLAADAITFRVIKGEPSPRLTQNLLVSNGSTGVVNGLTSTVLGGSGWLDVTVPASGTAPGVIELTVDDTGPPGTLTETVEIASSVAGVAADSVIVVLELLSTAPSTAAVTSVSPSTVDFVVTATDAPGTQKIAIENAGGGTLTGLDVDPATLPSWLGWSLSGTTAPAVLELDVDTTGLAPGTRVGTVGLTSDVDAVSVPVSFTLLPGPELALSADTVRFSEVARQPLRSDGQDVLVWNGSGGTLSGLTLTGVPPWLDSSLVSQTAPTSVMLRPNSTTVGTPPDTLTATLLVNSPVASNGPRPITVVYEIAPPAALAVSRDSVRFGTTQTGPGPATQIVHIENVGEGLLTGLAISPATVPGWLGAALSSTTAPAALTLQVDPGVTPRTPDTLVANLEITSPVADPVTLPVRFTIEAGPTLAISSDSVTFRGVARQPVPAAQSLAVSNGAAGVLDGLSVSGAPTWLDTSLSARGAPARLTLRPNTTAGLAPGTQSATVRVESPAASAGPRDITVTYQLAPPATIVFSPDSVHFTATQTDPLPGPQAVRIDNDSAGALTGLAVDPATVPSWLGWSLSGTTAPAVLELEPTTATLPPGTRNAELLVTSSVANAARIPVTYTVLPGPTLALTADSVTFRAVAGQTLPPTRIVTVSNGSAGVLGGVAVDAATVPGWLTATPTAATAAPMDISMRPATTSLAPGTLVDTLRVVSSVASNSPRELVVVYEIEASPVLAASPHEVILAGVAGATAGDAQLVEVTNAGGGTLANLSVVSSDAWLGATLDSRTAPATLSLTADPSRLPPGTHRATASIESADAANIVDVAVTFDVAAPPTISLSPASVSFHSIEDDAQIPAEYVVSVMNSGSGGLRNIAAAPSQRWLTVVVDSGTTPTSVRIQPTSILEPSDTAYRASVEVSSTTADNSPQAIHVEYTVRRPSGPVIGLSPESLTFGRENPPAQTVRITNRGSGTLRELAVRDQTDVDWLFVLLDSRVAPATLTVAVVAANVAHAPPNSVARLEISGEGAEPRILTVHLP